ncbi:hypothetical protein HU200_007528 [Digitaria exilis]|uniref:Reverse transcriptase zinc-binding domain-containing protein n=1 Tax=Digitaria exilis TaxID=1010633 RepID=A0A835FPD8_9POAL|nr:hypothetical protein HU200_007528 [Digitaria exilis]
MACRILGIPSRRRPQLTPDCYLQMTAEMSTKMKIDQDRSKEDGGLGIKDLATLNKSLMLKHIHKLLRGDRNPWADWIRFWYDGGRADDETPCWRYTKKLIPEYRQITEVELGDGETTSFWHDTWSEAGVLREALPALFSHCLNTDVTVAEVMAAGGLGPTDLQPRLSTPAASELVLLHDALHAIAPQPCPDNRWLKGGAPLADINWDSFAPKKVQVFFWILRHHRTRTRDRLHRRGLLDAPDCPFCPGAPEDEDHLFATCQRLQPLWELLLPEQPPPTSALGAAEAVREAPPPMAPCAAHTAGLAVLWIVWKSRNSMVFNNDAHNTAAIARMVRHHVELWLCRAPRRLDVEPLRLWCSTALLTA